MDKKKSTQKISATEVLSLDGILELLQDSKKLFWLNFKAGFVRGFAGVIGAIVALLLVGYIVANFGGLPVIGDVIKDIGEAAQTTK